MSCGPQKTASKIVLNYSNPIGYGGGPSIKVTLDLDKKRLKFSFSCWCGSWWYFLASVHFSDAQLVFWQSFINMFSFLEQSYIHFGLRCWSLRVPGGFSKRREAKLRHRTPNHFLSVFLLISAAIAFAIMWQNFPQQLRLRTLPTMSVCLLSLFFEHFFQLEIFTF